MNAVSKALHQIYPESSAAIMDVAMVPALSDIVNMHKTTLLVHSADMNMYFLIMHTNLRARL